MRWYHLCASVRAWRSGASVQLGHFDKGEERGQQGQLQDTRNAATPDYKDLDMHPATVLIVGARPVCLIDCDMCLV